MSLNVDRYIEEVINKGSEGSAMLAAMCAPTLKNCEYVDVLSSGTGGVAVLRIPKEYKIAVHSATGDPYLWSPEGHAGSMVDRIVGQAYDIGGRPIAFADVIDASEGGRSLVKAVGSSIVAGANKYRLAVVNGELAILGYIITKDANVTGTMITMVPRDRYTDGIHKKNGTVFAVFDPEGMAVFANSDGVGSKTEIGLRAGNPHRNLRDSAAMKADDRIKYGARGGAFSDTVEYRGDVSLPDMEREALAISEEVGAYYIIQPEYVGDRLMGWKKGAPALNISGSVVSVIDEERLKNPPAPREGDHILALRGKPNPRSNGITSKRELMVQHYGVDWHENPELAPFLEFLSEPSTILYPVFDRLLREDAATSFQQMSGGAYNGKLAGPLARHGFYAMLRDLFKPDWREAKLAELSSMPAEVSYAKWPMGTEGFVTTGSPERAEHIIGECGLESKDVGMVERRADGKTGVELAGIRGSDGRDVYFSGR